ncbi:unnamed protein product [Acanthosepion pharaonis]|uniref:Uncharacterized protein n=1 Tax=Acanthosepion pharaonis TaxID=158019 RepID=A0A812DFM8_ACAPH|nr:unnamed protein product [Sepia pharaonis]
MTEIETKSNISFFLNEIQKWLHVEEFINRLRQGIEETKKSIEQLSIDCEENCTKVRQEFDEFRKETRMKAEELCGQMREKTSEKERKWRQSLKEKERLSLSDDDEVVSGVGSLGAELSGRLHESFPPVEEGHFVMTFPEWCQRSLDQLQEEIVGFKTWPPRELELESEFRLRDSNLQWIESIAASDKDGHVFVVDGDDGSIKEFGETGEFLGRCLLGDEGFLPWDICCFSQDNFVVCGWGWESGFGLGWETGFTPPPASKFHPSLFLKLFFSLFSTLSSAPTFPLSLYLLISPSIYLSIYLFQPLLTSIYLSIYGKQ